MTKITENLVNMIFNLIAYETNENMRIIAIFSVVFLPMTFIAGFFGMNFKTFPQLDYDLSYFWWVTGVSTAIMFVIGTYSIWTKWVARFFRYLLRRRKAATQKSREVEKRL
ncbi:hypothetical protein RclHR1_07760004 [Rhizophagus clarus]|nr:hypothetical protein RclHR1_07760004 [Rhizophagus clarus]